MRAATTVDITTLTSRPWYSDLTMTATVPPPVYDATVPDPVAGAVVDHNTVLVAGTILFPRGDYYTTIPPPHHHHTTTTTPSPPADHRCSKARSRTGVRNRSQGHRHTRTHNPNTSSTKNPGERCNQRSTASTSMTVPGMSVLSSPGTSFPSPGTSFPSPGISFPSPGTSFPSPGTFIPSSGGRNLLQLLLSFAVGGLLGDVFLHLLPEAWSMALEGGADTHEAFIQVGLCVLAGIFVFIIVEMMATHSDSGPQNNNNNNKGGSGTTKKEVTGYLNLIANGIDNFTHGLAVAGSFMVSYKTGLLTTGAILIHEVPHEIGDFAILLKSGGVQVYILAFTAGGFLNIALVTVLPELLQEDRPAQSCAQLLCLLFGCLTMASVAVLC
ncbi:Zinc transporter ZIP13-like 1 [Homarus americanus]|uniref:Zinc transporter ZIP13-like 1 n=1 Tax=Homarus americanus TaxID=6706 RepID=A0A8J5MWR7_HOMAM|nr:Zinc transporter ZIP13-like 1 [Homarus americanus]